MGAYKRKNDEIEAAETASDDISGVKDLPVTVKKRQAHKNNGGKTLAGDNPAIEAEVKRSIQHKQLVTAHTKGVVITAKEREFARYICDGDKTSAAYKKAFDRPDLTDKAASKRGCNLVNTEKISELVSQYKKSLERACLWSRVDMIDMLQQIAVEAFDESHAIHDSVYNPESGRDEAVIVKKYDGYAAAVALKAIDQAAKMCGFNEPDKVDHEIRIVVPDDIKKIGG